MTVSINTAIAGGASGGSVDIASMTSAATVANSTEKTDFLTAVGAAQYLAPATEAANFTLTAASHANRRVDCTKGSAQAVSWASGHGMADGDSGRLMQVGAGAITITKDGGFAGGELKLATGVASATTVNDGDVLDWEYDATGERLLITYRSAAATSGASLVTPYSDGAGTQTFVSPGTSEFTMSSITVPADTIGANGWVEFFFSADRAATDALTTRVRVGNATTGTVLTNITAGARVVGFAAFVSQGSKTSHRSWAPETLGAAHGNTTTVTDTTNSANAITFFLTGQLASPGSTTVTKHYFKAKVFNPDA